MKTSILVFFISITTIIFSQVRKTVTIENKYQTEKYTINKTNEKKEGNYLVLGKTKTDTLVIGNYANDTKIGTWEYRTSQNRMYICYDYDNSIVRKFSNEISNIDSFYIKNDTAIVLTKVDRAPVYLGYKSAIKYILWKNTFVPIQMAQQGTTGTSLASFIVNTTGKISDIKIEKSINKDLDKIILNAISKVDGDWLPAIKSAVPVDSKIYILVNVSFDKITSKYTEKPYLLVHNLIYYR